jgi:hypothetical protein
MDIKQTLKDLIHDGNSISIEIIPSSSSNKRKRTRNNITYLDYDNPKFLRQKRKTNYNEYFRDENYNSSNLVGTVGQVKKTSKKVVPSEAYVAELPSPIKTLDSLTINYNSISIPCQVEYKDLTRVKLSELTICRFCDHDEMDIFCKAVESYISIPQFFKDHIVSSFDTLKLRGHLSEMFKLVSYFKSYNKFAILDNRIREEELLIMIDSSLLYKNFLPECEYCVLSIRESMLREKITICSNVGFQFLNSVIYNNKLFYEKLLGESDRELEESIKERNYLKRTMATMKFQSISLRKALKGEYENHVNLKMLFEDLKNLLLSSQNEIELLRCINDELVKQHNTELKKLETDYEELKGSYTEELTILQYLKQKFSVEIDVIDDFIIETYPDEEGDDLVAENNPGKPYPTDVRNNIEAENNEVQNPQDLPDLHRSSKPRVFEVVKKKTELCIICGINRRSVVFLTCFHNVLCLNCFHELSTPTHTRLKNKNNQIRNRTIQCILCETANDKILTINFN